MSHTFGRQLTAAERALRLDALADKREVLAATAETKAEHDHHEIAAVFNRMAAERIRSRAP